MFSLGCSAHMSMNWTKMILFSSKRPLKVSSSPIAFMMDARWFQPHDPWEISECSNSVSDQFGKMSRVNYNQITLQEVILTVGKAGSYQWRPGYKMSRFFKFVKV